jgi:hypothetical protein
MAEGRRTLTRRNALDGGEEAAQGFEVLGKIAAKALAATGTSHSFKSYPLPQ